MKVRTATLAALALTGILSFSQAIVAQGPPPPPSAWGDPNWTAPRGYNDAYQENGTPNMVARQGYAAGFSQGESDGREGHSFRPTKVDTYKHVPDSPKDVNRNDFKRVYRASCERGYSKAYGR